MGRTTTDLKWFYSYVSLYVTELPDMKPIPVTSDQLFAAWYVGKIIGLCLPLTSLAKFIGLSFFVYAIYEYSLLPPIVGLGPIVGFGPLVASLVTTGAYESLLQYILKPVFATCPLMTV